MHEVYVSDHAVQRLLERAFGVHLPWADHAERMPSDRYRALLAEAARSCGMTFQQARRQVLPRCPHLRMAMATLGFGAFPHDRYDLYLQLEEGCVVTVYQKPGTHAKQRQRKRHRKWQSKMSNSGAVQTGVYPAP